MELPKSYAPNEHEARIYALWEQNNAFSPSSDGPNYSIVMPPPNANANLHIGYALTAALEDIPIRYHRMKGHSTLLVPGADHAGFETQSVYEKHLAKEGKSRFDFSREDLYNQIHAFVAENRDSFTTQFRRLGVSCDWNTFTFTLDEKIVNRAYQTFKQLWDDGLVYRGERLVNYCTYHGTAFADIEVAYAEQKTKLWHLRYPLTDGSGEVIVATTRPETMLGDTAVAVHPNDSRYTTFVGKTVRLPITGREVPIITDTFVDQAFGSGAVKLTPAHDQNDFDAAERHSLPKITIIDHEGKMTAEVPDAYRGLTIQEARDAVVADLKAIDAIADIEDLTHNVAQCYKCGTTIEPLLREQWFVDMQPLAQKAIAALKANKITFYPASKKDQLIGYLENLRDWNISRQIAWGIPIPAYQNVDEPDDWIYSADVSKEFMSIGGKTYHRDPDVFDTWFSSSSWPYATLEIGSELYNKHYPLSLMETGGEILYPWVSRMIMLGLYVTGKVPFKAVYIHGYVMAEDGSKMSKSIGNVVDPLPVIDEYGSDALRMGIIAGRSPAVNRGYDRRRIEEARNFCNKLWNIARYTSTKVGTLKELPTNAHPLSPADHWILNRLNQATERIENYLDEYRFSEAYDQLYHFVWDDLADWYIEATKTDESREVLAVVIDHTLRLAHPFAPFVTEAIWQSLSWTQGTMLAISAWPKHHEITPSQANAFDQVIRIVTETRTIVKELHLREAHLYHKGDSFLDQFAPLITRLAHIQGVSEVSDGSGLRLQTVDSHCWLDVDPATAQSYLATLEAKEQDTLVSIAQLEKRLANSAYVQQAPKQLVEETRQSLEAAQASLERIRSEEKRFREFSS